MKDYNLKIAKWVIIYLWVTMLLYLFGPIDYIEPQKFSNGHVKLVLFTSLVCISFYLGCKTIKVTNEYYVEAVKEKRSFIFLLIFSVFLSSFLIIEGIKNTGFKFSKSLGEIYFSNIRRENDLPVSRIGQVYVLASSIITITTIIGFYQFSELNWYKKFVFILFLGLTMFYRVFILGTQKGTGDIIIYALIVLIIKGLQQDRSKIILKKMLLLIVFFIAFFLIMQISRNEAIDTTGLNENSYVKIDNNNWIYNVFGHKVGEGLLTFTLYLSHGYHGLTYCLDLPFRWTNMYGSSFALSGYFEQYFGLPKMMDETYPLRMEKAVGWPGLMFWPTAFAWWASDLTFPGVIILMFFIGRFYCKIFREAFYYSDIISLTLLSYMTVLLVYLPDNNQLFQTRESLVGFITILGIRGIRKIRVSFKPLWKYDT